MYDNDYSWVPSFFAGLSAVAALGSSTVAIIKIDLIRRRAFKVWLLVPILLSIGLGVVAAIFGENLEPYSPILFVPIFAIIISPPWLVAASLAYAVTRSMRGQFQRRGVGK